MREGKRVAAARENLRRPRDRLLALLNAKPTSHRHEDPL